jgi:hypothetical protein
MRSRLLVASLLALLAVGTSTCGAIVSALPTVIAAVTDAVLILDQIEDFARAFFLAHPNADKEKAVARAVGKARAALITAQRAAKGAEKLDQARVDDAFADFRVAYQELRAVLDGVPGLRVQRPGGPRLAAGPGELVVPEPEALTLKVPSP